MNTNDPFAPNPYGQIPSDYSGSYQPSSSDWSLCIVSIIFSSFSWLLFSCSFPLHWFWALGGIVTGHLGMLSDGGRTMGLIGLALGYLNLFLTIAIYCVALTMETNQHIAPVNGADLPSIPQVETTSDPAEAN